MKIQQHQIKTMKSKRIHYLVSNENIFLNMNNKLELQKVSEDDRAIYFEFQPYKKLVETKSVFLDIFNSGDIGLMFDFL